VQIKWSDYSGAKELIDREFGDEWSEIEAVLEGMPLHLKASDQKGKEGRPIFDAVGTNAYVSPLLSAVGWQPVAIPGAYNFLGKGVDFGKDGVVLEVQFSNYPFLLNNLMRTELLFKSRTPMPREAVRLLVIVTKAHMFPASNSTLYYEQAQLQVGALATQGVFQVPIRLVGLFETVPSTVAANWTEYHAARYSRTTVSRELRNFSIAPGARQGNCLIRPT
jgi:hypothetical protein